MSIPEAVTRRIRIVLQQSDESEMYREVNSENIVSAEQLEIQILTRHRTSSRFLDDMSS